MDTMYMIGFHDNQSKLKVSDSPF